LFIPHNLLDHEWFQAEPLVAGLDSIRLRIPDANNVIVFDERKSTLVLEQPREFALVRLHFALMSHRPPPCTYYIAVCTVVRTMGTRLRRQE
jgi:hypothetical protein